MRVLVTGGTGFIGKHVIGSLVHRGVEVSVLSRDVKKAKSVLPANVLFHEWREPTKDLVCEEAFGGVKAVINLTGENVMSRRWTKKQKQRIHSSRVLTTRQLLRSMKQHQIGRAKGIRTFIHASAIGYYPMGTGGVLDEGSPCGGGFLSGVCRAWEEEVMQQEMGSIRKVIFRLGVVLGIEGGFLKQVFQGFNRHLGMILGSGEQWLNWITVSDVALLMTEATRTERYRGVYNAVTPHPISYRDFAHQLARYLGKRLGLRVSPWVLWGMLGERAGLVLGAQNVQPKRLVEEVGFDYQHRTLEDALKALLPKY